MKRSLAVATAGLLLTGLLACSSDNPESSSEAESAPSSSESSQASESESEQPAPTQDDDPAGSESTSEEQPPTPEEPTPTLGPPVTVTVILDVYEKASFAKAIEQLGEQGFCAATLYTALDSLGGDAVTLEVDGVEQVFTGRFEPASGNGPDIPCKAEAEIPNVPSGAEKYVATQTGSEPISLTGKATVTGSELERNANIINLQ